ncbi:MAG: hypothetical protein J6O53_03505, partial [Eubacterium sp.]|nr:hypothetical protein [Eubacterium sp.]
MVKNIRFDVAKMNGFQTLRYQLNATDIADEPALERARGAQIPGLLIPQYQTTETGRVLTVNAPDFPTLETHIQKAMGKQEVLSILKNLVITFSAGARGIPVTHIVKKLDCIFINAVIYKPVCIFLPVKQDSQSYTDPAEVPSFFRELISRMKFEEADRDNYVARLITELNSYQFSLDRFGKLVDELLSMAGAGMTGTLAGKVNRSEVLKNRAAGQVPPVGQPAPMGQPPMGQRPPMSQPAPMGQAPVGQSPMGQPPKAPVPPMGQAPVGQNPMGQPAPVVKPEEKKEEVKPEVKPEEKKEEVKPEIKPEEKKEEVKPEIKPEEKKEEVKPEVKPEEVKKEEPKAPIPPMGQVPPMGQPAPMGQAPKAPVPPMGQAPMGQAPMGQPPMGQAPKAPVPPMGQAPMGQPPLGQNPMGQAPKAPMGQAPMGQPSKAP